MEGITSFRVLNVVEVRTVFQTISLLSLEPLNAQPVMKVVFNPAHTARITNYNLSHSPYHYDVDKYYILSY